MLALVDVRLGGEHIKSFGATFVGVTRGDMLIDIYILATNLCYPARHDNVITSGTVFNKLIQKW